MSARGVAVVSANARGEQRLGEEGSRSRFCVFPRAVRVLPRDLARALPLVAFVRARAHLGSRHLPRSRAQRRERRVRRLRELRVRRPRARAEQAAHHRLPAARLHGQRREVVGERARERHPASSRIHRRRKAHASGACIRRSGRRARGRRRARRELAARGGAGGGVSAHARRSDYQRNTLLSGKTTSDCDDKNICTPICTPRMSLRPLPPPALSRLRASPPPSRALALACAAVSCGSVSNPRTAPRAAPRPSVTPAHARARAAARRSPATTRRFPPVPGEPAPTVPAAATATRPTPRVRLVAHQRRHRRELFQRERDVQGLDQVDGVSRGAARPLGDGVGGTAPEALARRNMRRASWDQLSALTRRLAPFSNECMLISDCAAEGDERARAVGSGER